MANPDSSAFTVSERNFLDGRDIGRIATAGARGLPHVAVVSYWYNPELDAIDMVGPGLADSVEFRHVRARRLAAFIVDDIEPPWRPRSVEVRGPAEALETTAGAVIRIRPAWISARGLDGTPMPRTRRTELLAGREHS